MKRRICLDCLWYEDEVYDDYVENIKEYMLFHNHYCKAHGFEIMDWEDIEEMSECPDYEEES